MRKYIEPKITAVELDSKQAILQVCKAAGAYFFSATQSRCMGPGGGAVCADSIKGKNVAFNIIDFEDEIRPS